MCKSPETPAPPVAKKVPHALETHGDIRADDYYWLKERSDPEVIAYLEAENAYTKAMTDHTAALREKLAREFRERIKQTDDTVPYRLRDYYYYAREVDGKQYPIYCRKKGSLEAPEEVLLDVNDLAEGHDFFALGGQSTSAGQKLLAYTADTQGRRIYTLFVKNLETGELLADVIPEITSNFAWAEDDRTIFYTKHDPDTLRAYRVYRHTLGSDPAADELVFEETDETFHCSVFKTKSRRYLMIGSFQTVSTEYRFLETANPSGEFQMLEPRRRDHEYFADHHGDHFYIKTNDAAKNFRLMRAPVGQPGREHWQEVLPHREDVLLESFDVFREHLVAEERKGGLMRLRVMRWDGSQDHQVEFEEPAYQASTYANPEIDSTTLRYRYESMTTPDSVFDYGMNDKQKTLKKQDEVLGGFDKINYVTERLWATARDGVKVPISLVYRKGFERNGKFPLLLYGYGSYGHSLDANFDPSRISLLDRGFVYAVAHIRGGEELGRQWYENGKLLNKKNTFSDFIDCAEHLLAQKYADPNRLFARGGSAGGLLMGAVVNMRPELWKGVIADVPFVDVVTTMLDASIPLTTFEYDEWGNPEKKEFYDYMLSYSPYDQVEAKAYPAMLVMAGLHDSQVQYWEPAKWVAKLRALKTDDNVLLLKTEMEAGHGGVSGRYKRYEETAFRYAFLLDLAGIAGE